MAESPESAPECKAGIHHGRDTKDPSRHTTSSLTHSHLEKFRVAYQPSSMFLWEIHEGTEHVKLHSECDKHCGRLFRSQCCTFLTPERPVYIQLCANKASIPVTLLLFLPQQQYRYLRNLPHTPVK